MQEVAAAVTQETRLTPDNAALLMLNHQTGTLAGISAIEPSAFRSNLLALAKVGKTYGSGGGRPAFGRAAGCGHFVPEERPHGLCLLLVEFLDLALPHDRPSLRNRER